MSRVSTVLNRAADEMEKHGKARGALVNRNGNVCALGAIRLASGGVFSDDLHGGKHILTSRMDWEIFTEAYRALHGYLLSTNAYKTYDQKDNGVAGWNDRNNKSTVVTAMREAAISVAEDKDN